MRLHRRYRCWEDVTPPRSSRNVVEMLLYRQFHVENLAETLRWQVQVIRELDDCHELRAHGANIPRLFDQACAREVDSWGMSMPSNEPADRTRFRSRSPTAASASTGRAASAAAAAGGTRKSTQA